MKKEHTKLLYQLDESGNSQYRKFAALVKQITILASRAKSSTQKSFAEKLNQSAEESMGRLVEKMSDSFDTSDDIEMPTGLLTDETDTDTDSEYEEKTDHFSSNVYHIPIDDEYGHLARLYDDYIAQIAHAEEVITHIRNFNLPIEAKPDIREHSPTAALRVLKDGARFLADHFIKSGEPLASLCMQLQYKQALLQMINTEREAAIDTHPSEKEAIQANFARLYKTYQTHFNESVDTLIHKIKSDCTSSPKTLLSKNPANAAIKKVGTSLAVLEAIIEKDQKAQIHMKK